MIKSSMHDMDILITKLHSELLEQGLTLAVAESCTGGLLSHLITDRAGASNVFKGGVVSYATEVKRSVLGVSEGTIKEHGVVSEQCAREMALGVARVLDADASIATTGNLGPDAMEGKPKGLVYIAAALRGHVRVQELNLTGNRADNKQEAARSAIALMVEMLEGHR